MAIEIERKFLVKTDEWTKAREHATCTLIQTRLFASNSQLHRACTTGWRKRLLNH